MAKEKQIDSIEQQRQEAENEQWTNASPSPNDEEIIDKKLDGPNRPST